MNQILNLLKTRTGMGLCFAAGVLVLFFLVGKLRKDTPREPIIAPRLPKIPLISTGGDTGTSGNPIVESDLEFSPFPPITPEPPTAKPVSVPEVTGQVFAPSPDLIHIHAPVDPPQTEDQVAEPVLSAGTMIRCRLVNTIESGQLESPVIAKVTAPVLRSGSVVLPRGSEIHGIVKTGRQRDRIETGRRWIVMTRSGESIRISGVGLNRDYDTEKDRFGPTDGSIGLAGKTVKPDATTRSKRLAATGGGAFARFAKRRSRTVYGDEPLSNIRNGALEGGASILDERSSELEKEALENRPFVRVPAGKEFYIYVSSDNEITREPLEPANNSKLEDALKKRERLMEELRQRLSQSQSR